MGEVDKVVARGHCLGCGLCVGLSEPGARMEMTSVGFWVPRNVNLRDESSIDRLCPGQKQEMPPWKGDPTWGPIVESREAWANDPLVRFSGSSGGVVSALAIYMLEIGMVDGVLHVAPDPSNPLRNQLRISRTRDEVIAGASSRYAPAITFPDWFWEIANSGKRYVYVGKPCDVGAVRNLQRENPVWLTVIPWTIGIFCAGMSAEKGTTELLEKLEFKGELKHLKYRGQGWPGKFEAVNHQGEAVATTYAESWGTTLNRHLHYRCKICPEGVGLQADFAVGDAWETHDGYPDFSERDGRSVVIARTGEAQTLLHRMIKGSILGVGDAIAPDQLAQIQAYQRDRRARAMYRVLALILALRPHPRYRGLRLLSASRTMRLKEGMLQTWGMWKRAVRRGRIE